MMKIKLSDFSHRIVGYGHYKVTYTSPKTGKTWSKIINDATIIDKIFHSDCVKVKDLDTLKWIVKNNK